MNRGGKMNEALFVLVEDALYVANGGRPFTRKGVIGICASHLSEKMDVASDNYPDIRDEDLVSAIQSREIRTYKNDSNRLTSDFRAEQEIGRDYGGRFVWELLQNANDVMGPARRRSADLIGTKGVGFKSVLEITEGPEIHSGPFHFKFSPDETQELLKRENIHENPPQLTFRIPHPRQPTKTTRKLLEAGYSTVIRLPFQDEEARKKAKATLETLEPYFLLLSQELESLRIILDGGERYFRVEREVQGFSDGRVALHTPSEKTSWKRWAATKDTSEAKSLTAAIALPLDEQGEVAPHSTELPFHVFFPTEENSDAKALIHVSFDLQQNRKHLRRGRYDEELLTLFSDVLERVIGDVPARTALETFRSVVLQEQSSSGLLENVEKTIREKIEATSFVPVIGGGRATPKAVRLWNDELGSILREDEKPVQQAKLVTPSLSDLSDVLKELGASETEDSEYVRLLRYCRNESLKDCSDSLRVLMEGGLKRIPYGQEQEQTLDLLRKIPCWWTEDERPRSLTDKFPLLWKKPENWPAWLVTDSLHHEFRAETEEQEEQQKGNSRSDQLFRRWKKLTDDFLLREKMHYIDGVLIPFVKKWKSQDWERQGYSALELLALWGSQYEFDRAEPCIKGEESRRNTLATVLHLPTDKGWLPAIDCFAGKDWNGPEAFDEFFEEQEKVGIVQSFEEWSDDLRETDQNKWKSLLRWIGVSWEPKVCQILDFTISSHRLWAVYSSSIRKRPRIRQGGKNYLIHDFPDCLLKIGKKESIQSILPALIKLSDKEAKKCWSHRTGHIVHSDFEQSFALEQLRKEAWLPVKKSLLEDRPRIPPSEAFLPNEGLSGLLPEVDRSSIDDNTWYGQYGIESKLRTLGVMDSLPEGDAKEWHEWMRSLAQKGADRSREEREVPPDWNARGAKDLWRAARSLYREYLKQEISGSFPDDIKIPCVCLENRQRTLHFSPPDEVYWVDEPHLTDSALEKEVLSQGYNLFIFRLKEEDKSERLGVRKLSNAIECRPRFDASSTAETEILSQRYKKRRIALEKVKKIKLPEAEAVDIKAVTNLFLELSANGHNLGRCSAHSWREEGATPILVNIESGEKKWRALADALAHRLRDKSYAAYANDFEVYLADDDDKSVLERARDAGVPEEALEEVENSFQQPILNGQSEEGTEPRSKDFLPEYKDTPSAAPSASDPTGQTLEDAEDTEQQTTNYERHEARQSTSRDGDGTTQSTGRSELGTSRSTPQSSGGNGQSRVGHQRLNDEARSDDLRSEIGLKAERWLEGRLHEQWPNNVEEVRTGRDFTLSVGGRTVHIEAKHVENQPGIIHWSDRQYERAKQTGDNEDSYFIAVLSPDSENFYAIHWIWDPLEELKTLERNLTWSGRSEPRPLQPDNWDVDDLKPPNVPSSNFSIEVKLTDDLFDEEKKDGPDLERLRAKVESHK